MIKKLLLCSIFFLSPCWGQESHIVYNLDKKETVTTFNEDKVRPIASLTKLMTALVIAESNVNMEEAVSYRGGIFSRKKIKRKDLIKSLLIKSDNSAAEALAKSWPKGRTAFIEEMNKKAKSLGMVNTSYTDPAGKNCDNISTVGDLVILLSTFLNHQEYAKISSTKYLVVQKKKGKKIKEFTIGNTNRTLLFEFDSIIISKTGWTTAAGRCLAMVVQNNGTNYALVILGEKNLDDRITKARYLINNFTHKKDTE